MSIITEQSDFIPASGTHAVDQIRDVSIVTARRGDAGPKYTEQGFSVQIGDRRTEFVVNGYGIVPTEVRFLIPWNFSTDKLLELVTNVLVSSEGACDLTRALFYISCGIVAASSGYKKYLVSACINEAEWKNTALALSPTVPVNERGERIMYQAAYS